MTTKPAGGKTPPTSLAVPVRSSDVGGSDLDGECALSRWFEEFFMSTREAR